MIPLLKVAGIATAMAAVGTLFLFGSKAEHHEWLIGFLPKVIIVSNLFWLAVVLTSGRRAIPLKWALELGAASPFLGAILLGIFFPSGFFRPGFPGASIDPSSAGQKVLRGIMVYLMGVTSVFWLYIPVGMATGYLIYRAQTREATLA